MIVEFAGDTNFKGYKIVQESGVTLFWQDQSCGDVRLS